jgi:hypothetical protein
MFRIQTNSRQDFSVSGYQHFNSRRPRDAGLVKAVRVLGDVAASAMGRLLDAMYTRSAFPWFESYQAASASL